MDRICPDHRVVCGRAIDNHVEKLRRKIETVASGEERIHSVYGAGYKFKALSGRRKMAVFCGDCE